MNEEPTVFVVDDEPMIRESLELLIQGAGFLTQCYASANAFLEALDVSQPGCLLLDVRMPEMSGIELQERLRQDRVPLPVIFITGHGDVPMCVRAIKKGAFHFFEKPYSPSKLLESVRQAIQLDSEQRRKGSRRREFEARIALLSSSERAIMKRVVAGKINKVIASELDISLRTMEYRKASLLRKLKVESRADLVEWVLSENMPLEENEGRG